MDLDVIRHRAVEERDAFEILMYRIQADDDIDDAHIDAWVDVVAAPIIAAIDCTQCANCCRSLDVYLTQDDAGRLVAGIDVPLSALMTDYVQQQASASDKNPVDDPVDDNEWGKFRAKPCAFLQGKLCSVYAHRPDSCRLYPQFTPDFRWTMEDGIDGAALCPIIYHVYHALYAAFDDFQQHAGRTP